MTSSYLKNKETVHSMRADFIIALIPVIAWSIVRFGAKSIILLCASALASALADFVIKTVSAKKVKSPSVYSVYLGLIFSLTLYSETSFIIAAFGGALSAVMLSMLGGEGQCFVFAPFAARIILYAALPAMFSVPGNLPAAALYSGALPNESSFDLILGTGVGSIGSISVIAVLISVLYLFVRRNADVLSPVSFILSITLLFFFFPAIQGRGEESVFFELICGEILFVFAFVLTNYSCNPVAPLSKIIFGLLTALLIFILRRNGYAEESAYFAVTISGILSHTFEHIYFVLKYKIKKKGRATNEA